LDSASVVLIAVLGGSIAKVLSLDFESQVYWLFISEHGEPRSNTEFVVSAVSKHDGELK